jgi:hypothetical protein
MRHSSHKLLVYGCVVAALLGCAACSPRRIPPMTVEDLMEDRVTLDGIMLKCNQHPARFRDTQDCENARIAIERLASQNADPSVEKKREEEFERARTQLRLAQERLRQAQEAKTKVDAYTLPLVPVNAPATPPPTPAPSAAPQTSGGSRSNDGLSATPPLAGTTTP